mmetsp:Transcript_73113/g.162383  ORF Transcript_73113/g.162383 Transcript_73113/m.162383 type:complete len:158 (-) Transcript_73113:505-978(-)
MNALAEKYGDKVVILGFPCNQFGHQTNEGPDEFMNTLKYVRPGNGFELSPEVKIMGKTDVNGLNAHPIFKWLKQEIMIPFGGLEDTKENGCADIDALVLPRGNFGGSTVVLWTPVCRSDIAWNFEKFLIGPDGQPVKRYSRYFEIGGISEDIDALLA